MATFQFILDLKEKVSKPLKKLSSNFDEIKKKTAKVQVAISSINSPLKKIGSTAGKLKTQFSEVNKTLGGLPVAFAGVFAVNKITEFGGAVVNTLAEFERFEAVLTNTLGMRIKG